MPSDMKFEYSHVKEYLRTLNNWIGSTTLTGKRTVPTATDTDGTTTKYVNSETGNDSGAGSLAQPYRSIAKAINAATAEVRIDNDGYFNDMRSIFWDEVPELPIQLDQANFKMWAVDGKEPIIGMKAGARVDRETYRAMTDANTIWVSKAGSAGGDGTAADPYLTILQGMTNTDGAGGHFIVGIADSGTYTENVTWTNTTSYLIAARGEVPVIDGLITAVNIYNGLCVVDGFFVNNTITLNSVGDDFVIINCTIKNVFSSDDGIRITTADGCSIYNNVILGYREGIFIVGAVDSIVIYFNEIIACYDRGIFQGAASVIANDFDCYYNKVDDSDRGYDLQGAADNTNFYHNIAMNCNSIGFDIDSTTTTRDTLEFNLSLDNDIGYYFDFNNNYTVNNNIAWGNSTNSYQSVGAITTGGADEVNNDARETAAVNVTIANEITAEPTFCDKDKKRFGLTRNANQNYWNDSDEGVADEVSLRSYLFTMKADVFEINGIKFQGDMINTFIACLQADDFTLAICRWCDFRDSGGIAIKHRPSGTDVAAVYNCLFNGCGGGIDTQYIANVITENIFYDVDYPVFYQARRNVFNHNTIYIAKTGVFSQNGGVVIKDSIIDNVSNYATQVSAANRQVTILNSCITGDTDYDYGLADNELANSENTKLGSMLITEDDYPDNETLWHHIRNTKDNFSLNDSPCILAGSDGKDMGAWDVGYAISNDDWQSWTPDDNPIIIPGKNVIVGQDGFNLVNGARFTYGKAFKRTFTIRVPGLALSEKDRLFYEYFISLIQTNTNDLTEEMTRIRFYPTQSNILGGTGDFTNATDKEWDAVFTDASLDLMPNMFRGFYLVYAAAHYLILKNDDTVMYLKDVNNAGKADAATVAFTVPYVMCKIIKAEHTFSDSENAIKEVGSDSNEGIPIYHLFNTGVSLTLQEE